MHGGVPSAISGPGLAGRLVERDPRAWAFVLRAAKCVRACRERRERLEPAVMEAPGAQRRVLEFCSFVAREFSAQNFGVPNALHIFKRNPKTQTFSCTTKTI